VTVAVSVTAALLGAGVYALVIGPIAQVLVLNVLLWTAVRWHPRHGIVPASIKRLWSFSGGQVGFNLVNYWTRNADNLLVGRYAGTAQLGLYNRSYNVMMLPLTLVGQTLARVLFPALASLGDDVIRVAGAYRRTMRLVCAVVFPVLLILAASAHSFIVTVWGPAWSPSADLLVLLCLSAVPQCLMTSVGCIYQSQGRTDLLFKTGCVSAMVTVAAFLMGVPWGAAGIATAMLIRCWLIMPWILAVPAHLIGLRAREVMRDNVPTALAASGAGLLALAAGVVVPSGTASVDLLVRGVVGVATYLVLLRTTAPALLAELRDVALRRARLGRLSRLDAVV